MTDKKKKVKALPAQENVIDSIFREIRNCYKKL
jgi:hypothetical protein